MQMRTPRELGHLLVDGRRRMGWSQSRLASRAGVSRQWISLVENGKTSAEFDLVLATLQALGYTLDVDWRELNGEDVSRSGHRDDAASSRTRLTRAGVPLGRRPRRKGRGP
jgi:y4mF family transcriptional regulator